MALPSNLTGCERNYDPALGFDVGPFWKELDPLKNLTLLKKMMLLEQPPSQGIPGTIFDGDNFVREIKGQMKHGGVKFSIGKIDIDNDGRPEPVLKLRKGACIGHDDALHVQYQSLIVLRNDQSTIDDHKTDLITHNPRKSKKLSIGDSYDRLYDVFLYAGQVYFDKWELDELDTSKEYIFVYRASGKKVSQLCKYRYERRYRTPIQGEKP